MPERGAARQAVPLYAGMVLAWGFNYVAVRWGLAYASPLLLALVRAVIGSLAMLAFLAATGPLGVLDRRGRRDALLIGVPTTAIFYGLWFVAAGTVEPGLASILVYTFPLWVSLLSGPVLGVLPRRGELLAVAVGFAGVGLATEPWRGASASIVASAELLLGAISWAFGTVLFKRRFHGGEVQEANLYQLVGGSLGLGAGVLLLGAYRWVPGLPLLAIVLWVGIVGTAFGYGSWYYLLDRWRASTVSTYSFLVPVSALGFSALLLGERPDLVQLAGVTLVLVAIVTAARSGGGSRSPRAPSRASRGSSTSPTARPAAGQPLRVEGQVVGHLHPIGEAERGVDGPAHRAGVQDDAAEAVVPSPAHHLGHDLATEPFSPVGRIGVHR